MHIARGRPNAKGVMNTVGSISFIEAVTWFTIIEDERSLLCMCRAVLGQGQAQPAQTNDKHSFDSNFLLLISSGLAWAGPKVRLCMPQNVKAANGPMQNNARM